MNSYEVVVDTNVLVAAARSQRGASYALLQTLPGGKWKMNVSSALVMEYESKLKIEAARQNRPLSVVDEFLDFLVSISGRRQIYFLLRPFLRDAGDDFIIELAVASRADFIVTHNIRDFAGAAEYGIRVIKPHELLRLLESKL
jgi:putative PIN family toxin of toxin-antitoxin system